MVFLHSLWPSREFSLPEFELVPLVFEPQTAEECGELLLDEVVATIGPEPRAGPVLEAVPTAGELSASIERHLRSVQDSALPPDAANELRNALAELRRSIR